jgi:hypothetical protein
MDRTPELPLFLTLAELAELMRLTPATARWRRYQRMPMPPAIKIGTKVLFPRDDAIAWLEEHREAVK